MEETKETTYSDDRYLGAYLCMSRLLEYGKYPQTFYQRDYEVAVDVLRQKVHGCWIPVSERLPNKNECNKYDKQHPNHRKFIGTIKFDGYEPLTREIYYLDWCGWSFAGDDCGRVTAWQPLPEPYVGGTK